MLCGVGLVLGLMVQSGKGMAVGAWMVYGDEGLVVTFQLLIYVGVVSKWPVTFVTLTLEM